MNFWHVLWSGEWLANVGVPLLLAGAALWFAVHALGRQLRSDRELARSERNQARAERFAEALRDTARALRDFADEVRDPAFVPPRRDGGHTRLLRLTERLRRAILRARETLGNTDAVADVSRFEESLRKRFSKWTLNFLSQAQADGYSVEDIHLAWANLVDQYAQYFELTAANFEDWDGLSELRLSAARQPQQFVDIPFEFGTVGVSPLPTAMLGETAGQDEYFTFVSILRGIRQARTRERG